MAISWEAVRRGAFLVALDAVGPAGSSRADPQVMFVGFSKMALSRLALQHLELLGIWTELVLEVLRNEDWGAPGLGPVGLDLAYERTEGEDSGTFYVTNAFGVISNGAEMLWGTRDPEVGERAPNLAAGMVESLRDAYFRRADRDQAAEWAFHVVSDAAGLEHGKHTEVAEQVALVAESVEEWVTGVERLTRRR